MTKRSILVGLSLVLVLALGVMSIVVKAAPPAPPGEIPDLKNFVVTFVPGEEVLWELWPAKNAGDMRADNLIHKTIDEAYLRISNPLDAKFYSLKRAGLVTPKMQVGWDRYTGLITSIHEYMLIQAGIINDYWVDEVWDEEVDPPVLIKPGTILRSQDRASKIAELWPAKADMLAFKKFLKVTSTLPGE